MFPLREKLAGVYYENLSQLAQKAAIFDSQLQGGRKENNQFRNNTLVESYESDETDDEVAAAEWNWSKKAVFLPKPWGIEDNYDFDVNKADQLFDFLLEKGQIKLPKDYAKLTAEQLKKRFCKYHCATSHRTNKCSVFRAHSQRAIQQRLLKFDSSKKMDVDRNPFPRGQNMVDMVSPKGKIRLLTSASAKEAAIVDPEMHISVEEYEMIKKKREDDKSRCEQENASKKAISKKVVASQILLNKWQRQKEKDHRRRLIEEEEAYYQQEAEAH